MALHEVAISGELLSINPATGELMRRYPTDTDAVLAQKLNGAAEAFARWGHMDFGQRARFMRRAADVMETERQSLARIATLEMGKPLRAAVQEIEKSVRCCRYYAENACSFLADEPIPTETTRTFVCYQPLGVVLAIMPWNFPFWQVFRFAAPALMAGNVALLKHASNVPQCAVALEDIFRRADFPEGVFQSLLIGSDRVTQLIADSRITAITLTGSVGAGSRVAETAGRHIKKTVLELGGSDAYLVMPSADLDSAIATAVQARMINNAQSCIAAKRFIIHEAIYPEFERRFVERMAGLKLGDPLDETTDVGPLATGDVRKTVEEQVRRTVQMGARVLLGGERLKGKGNFYSPTVLADIPKQSPARREEIFGPVAPLFRVNGIEEAIALANDSSFGLACSCWTDNQRERELVVQEIEAGTVFINGMVASDPRVPFGGVKQSGYGRELGVHGIREFVNTKTVSIFEIAPRGNRTE